MIFNLNRAQFGASSYSWDGADPVEWAHAGSDWMMALPISGNLTLLVGIPRADICVVAGGSPGADGGSGLAGGAGGQALSFTDVSLPAGIYVATVGESGQDTTLLAPDGRSWEAESGEGSAGGRPGSDGVLAWGDPDTLLRAGWLYGPGGGSGSILDYQYVETPAALAGSVGAASDDTSYGKGGEHGVGHAGLDGTGQGGGGGSRVWNGTRYVDYTGGAGGVGCILIRKHVEVAS